MASTVPLREEEYQPGTDRRQASRLGSDRRIASYAANAQDSLAQHVQACVKLAEATRVLTGLEAQRSEQKVAAIYRLLDVDFAPGKKFTMSQASDFALIDPEYREYKSKVHEWTQIRLEHDLHRETAKLACELYVALVRSEAGLV